MMHSADLQRLTRDWNAGVIANDNAPLPERYDDSEGMGEWFAEIRASIRRTMLVSAYLAAVIAGCVWAFNAGRGL